MRNPFTYWNKLQRAVKPNRYYGDGGTIHGTKYLDVEVYEGEVVAVWFRCQQLPFKVTEVNQSRAAEMRRAFSRRTATDVIMPTGTHTYITGVILDEWSPNA